MVGVPSGVSAWASAFVAVTRRRSRIPSLQGLGRGARALLSTVSAIGCRLAQVNLILGVGMGLAVVLGEGCTGGGGRVAPQLEQPRTSIGLEAGCWDASLSLRENSQGREGDVNSGWEARLGTLGSHPRSCFL